MKTTESNLYSKIHLKYLTQTNSSPPAERKKRKRVPVLNPFFAEIFRIEFVRVWTPNVLPLVQGVQAQSENVSRWNLDAIDFDLGRVFPSYRRNGRPVALHFVHEHLRVG